MKDSFITKLISAILIAIVLTPIFLAVSFLFALGFILESNEPFKYFLAIMVFWIFCMLIKFIKEFSVPGIQVIWNSFFEEENQQQLKD